MHPPRLPRRWLPGLLAVPLAAATIFVPISMSASADTSAPFYFVQWQLGTPLPTVPAGDTVQAMPNQEGGVTTMTAGTPLQMAPVTLPASSSSADQQATETADTTALAGNANVDGNVNLVVFSPGTACSPGFNYDEGAAWTDVAQGYTEDSHDNQQFTYLHSVTSTLEIGVSASDQYGSFSADGTTGVSGGGGAQAPYMIGISQDVYQTEFDWENLKWTCGHGVFYYTSNPYTWLSSGTYYHPAKPPLPPHCYFYKKGYEPIIDTTKAKTFSQGFNILGFGGSSQTGYSTTLSFKYYYGENGYMCGDELYPNPGFDFPYAIP